MEPGPFLITDRMLYFTGGIFASLVLFILIALFNQFGAPRRLVTVYVSDDMSYVVADVHSEIESYKAGGFERRRIKPVTFDPKRQSLCILDKAPDYLDPLDQGGQD